MKHFTHLCLDTTSITYFYCESTHSHNIFNFCHNELCTSHRIHILSTLLLFCLFHLHTDGFTSSLSSRNQLLGLPDPIYLSHPLNFWVKKFSFPKSISMLVLPLLLQYLITILTIKEKLSSPKFQEID